MEDKEKRNENMDGIYILMAGDGGGSEADGSAMAELSWRGGSDPSCARFHHRPSHALNTSHTSANRLIRSADLASFPPVIPQSPSSPISRLLALNGLQTTLPSHAQLGT